MKLNKYWFKPRGFGYGATPTTWEGWAVVAGFIIYLLSLSFLLTKEGNSNTYLLLLFAGIIAVFLISKNKTDGEWEWNWGGKKKKDFDIRDGSK